MTPPSPGVHELARRLGWGQVEAEPEPAVPHPGAPPRYSAGGDGGARESMPTPPQDFGAEFAQRLGAAFDEASARRYGQLY